MPLTRDQFRALVEKLEVRAKANRQAYAGRVLALAVLGNAYLLCMVLVLLAVFAALLASIVVLKAIGVKLAIVVGALLWMIVKTLWIRLEPPQGIEVQRAQAPALFALLDELRGALRTGGVHHVLVTDDFNAGVVQVPRLGILGWPRNYLLIGLPLLSALDPQQFKAVLAHEMGHLAGNHGRLSNWVYRQRLRWQRLDALFQARPSKADFLFVPFLRWYAPYFCAYSFPLARANEYEADEVAARLTSAAALATALTSTEVVGRYLKREYWPGLYRTVADHPQPAFLPYAQMHQAVAARLEPVAAQAWLDAALQEQTGVDDSHPALADRLQALGEPPRLQVAGGGDAAQALLGDAQAAITQALENGWRARVLADWEQRHQAIQKDRARLAELDTLARDDAPLAPQQAFDRALLTESVGAGAAEGLRQLQDLLARLPESGIVNLEVGARLLRQDDEGGYALVEKSMQLDAELGAQACEILRDRCWRTGRRPQADQWHERLQACLRQEQERQAAQEERQRILTSDRFTGHGLAADQREALRTALQAAQPLGLRKAYYVRKVVRHDPQTPRFVLGFRVRSRWGAARTRQTEQVMAYLKDHVDFPGATLIFSVDTQNRRFGRKFAWMRGARIL
jgi:Zn-dependent protease with chaperone function